MAEDYVRPPILAVEPPSRRAATWRFRVVLGLILLALAAGITFAVRAITSSNDNGGAVGGRLTSPIARDPARPDWVDAGAR